jgi:glycerol-3-phosphate dehydrogenase subunit B
VSAASPRVVVVGAGAAGTAAAFAAKDAGADVVVAVGRPGATSLASGALDGDERDLAVRADLGAFLRALGIWEMCERESYRVATTAGVVRDALGRDVNVLDLGRVRPGVVAVVRADRAGWDAELIARAWSREAWAIAHGLSFLPVDVDPLRTNDERTMPDADLAARHDDAERAAWLAARLGECREVQKATGVVLGPWLGIRRPVALELANSLKKPVGESLSLPGGVAGLRFEWARDEVIARHAIARVDDEVSAVEPGSGSAPLVVHFSHGLVRDADAVVLATGGLVGGGVGWAGLAESREAERAPWNESGFCAMIRLPVGVALDDTPLGMSGSPQGALFETYAWTGGTAAAKLERVGIWTTSDGRARARDGAPMPSVFCAGDTIAGAPRSMLHAVRSGLAAGERAASAARAR